MTEIVSKPNWGAVLIEGGKAAEILQLYLDDITERLNTNLLGNQVQLSSYVVTDVPSAAIAGGLIFVSDETGGAVPAFSDGINWRRVTDRVIVS